MESRGFEGREDDGGVGPSGEGERTRAVAVAVLRDLSCSQTLEFKSSVELNSLRRSIARMT